MARNFFGHLQTKLYLKVGNMSDRIDNEKLSMISAVLSLVGAIFLVGIVVGFFNGSVRTGGLIAGLLVVAIAGAAGAIAGKIARRSGRNALNGAGFWFGLAEVMIILLGCLGTVLGA